MSTLTPLLVLLAADAVDAVAWCLDHSELAPVTYLAEGRTILDLEHVEVGEVMMTVAGEELGRVDAEVGRWLFGHELHLQSLKAERRRFMREGVA